MFYISYVSYHYISGLFVAILVCIVFSDLHFSDICISYLQDLQIILVEGLIFGQMLAEVGLCSVLLDPIVRPTLKKSLVLAGYSYVLYHV